MKDLAAPDSHYLAAAQGWLELGDWASANQELDKINPTFCIHTAVLQTRYRVYAAGRQWAMAAAMARALTVMNPAYAMGWIDWAYALYELNRVDEAQHLLLTVVEKFPRDYLIRYSLACYTCRLGDYKEALHWLEKAIQLADANGVRQMVVNNPDLQPLWNQLKGK
jgi:tetratricopeptide (TPR) repeat protein